MAGRRMESPAGCGSRTQDTRRLKMKFRKAQRSAAKLRLLLESPSGGGKTFGALTIAKGMGGRVVVIDTENGSSDRYDKQFDFEVGDLKPPFTPEAYIAAIKEAEREGYDIIIVDSITHEWSGEGGCLELIDSISKANYRGNTWSAWSEVTPRHRKFMDCMLRSSAHIICTTRSKTETAQVEERGKKVVKKLGMKAETRDGAEYEFDCVLSIVHDGHYATVSKDRTGLFSGRDPKPITVETGRQLAEWLAVGKPIEDAAPAKQPAEPTQKPGWLDRVRAATTVSELFRLGNEAGLDVTLKPEQRKRLKQAIVARSQEIEPEDTATEPFDSAEVDAEANQ
jgi:hypothetical protein